MKIYVAHSSAYDYKKELYYPLRQASLNKNHEITLPHEQSTDQFNSKEYLKNCDLVVAEVSFPSTGQGIELGWANMLNVPIVAISKSGTKPSGSINGLTNHFLEYKDSEDMIDKLTDFLGSGVLVKA